MFAYGSADVAAIPKPRHLLPHLNADWFLPFWYKLTQVLFFLRRSVDDVVDVQAKESWEMDPPEKLEQSEISKNKGTDYFKARLNAARDLCVY